MKALSEFYDHLLPELPGCTTAMVDLHLLHAARDFCESTSAWRYDWTQATTADRALYDISQPELQSQVVRVTRLAVAGVLLFDDRWNPDSDGDEPKYDRAQPPFTMDALGTELTLTDCEVPTASAAGALALTAALKPSFTATKLPDLLLGKYLEAMRTGTLARLMVLGKKPWTDRDLAGVYRSDYQRLALAAATRAQQGNTKARLRTRKWG